MYNNPYYQNAYNPQVSIDRINNQIADLEKMRQQLQQPPQQPQAITQNFQLAPNNNGMRYVNTIDDVSKEIIYFDTPFFSKDMTVMWVKNAKGDIKSYELREIIPKDNKDLQIEYLQAQIEELKGRMDNERVTTNANQQQISKYTKDYDEPIGEQIENDKPSSVSKVSRGKKEQ